jgi:superfamily I DNA/RNA helicase
MPNAMLEALRHVPQRFDAIVVDEGQDFLEGWWYPLQFCLADPDRSVLYIFHDDNQQIYRRATSFPRASPSSRFTRTSGTRSASTP